MSLSKYLSNLRRKKKNSRDDDMFKMLKMLARASQEANKETEQWRKGLLM